MSILDFLKNYWTILTASPIAFLGTLFIGGAAGYWLARNRYLGTAEAARERAQAGQDKAQLSESRYKAALEDLEHTRDRAALAEKQAAFLVGKLILHGEQLDELQHQMKSVPKLIVSSRPPGPGDPPTDGTIWIQTGEAPPTGPSATADNQ